MQKLIVTSSIAINAAAAKVWDVLVNPLQTQKYMFGCRAISDWKVGCPLVWKASHEGREMVFVKGFILEIEPGKLLKYSVIDPNASYADVPENYLNVTYELVPEEDKIILIVNQNGFENAAEGEKRYKETYNNGEGWNPILEQIKKIVEEQ